MHQPLSAIASRNDVLNRLTASDLGLLKPYFEIVDLPVRTKLEQRNRDVEYVYFLSSGIASVVSHGDREVEIGIIGREGLTGLSVILGATQPAINDSYMQLAGAGHRISSAAMIAALDESPTLLRQMLGFAHEFLAQVTQTALANARGSIEQRLSRWLLMVADRVDGDEVPMTHEFLSIMLATRRAGVTIALQELERTGAVQNRRSVITITDREALEDYAGSIYLRKP